MNTLISFFFLLTTYCYSQAIVNKTITINPYLSFQNYEHFKRLTLNSPNSSIEYLDNFEFAWGYTYLICVKETVLDESLSDGTKFLYSLGTIISKKRVEANTKFNLFLDANRYYNSSDSSEEDSTFERINDTTYLYFNKVEIEIPRKFLKKFHYILDGKTTQLGEFIFIDDRRIKLISLK